MEYYHSEPKTKKYRTSRRRIMSRSTECKHKPIPEIENKLYPDYDHGLSGLKEEQKNRIRC